ncbi:MAG TPA: hypothetical protein VJV75_00510 [Candidatus Polarisedimenticolia bacterium]|nr:hypothetical protein [Candidatus Polarisedimenticolia bacterium]
MSATALVQAMVIAAILIVYLAACGSIRYRVTPDSLVVEILGIAVRRFRLDDIEEVHREGHFPHESWGGWALWNSVTLRRRSGLLRHVIVTPDDPDRFVADLNRILAERGARSAPQT